jgi:hypothetical protein
VLLNAEQVAEANVEELDVLVLDKKKDFRGVCEHRGFFSSSKEWGITRNLVV